MQSVPLDIIEKVINNQIKEISNCMGGNHIRQEGEYRDHILLMELICLALERELRSAGEEHSLAADQFRTFAMCCREWFAASVEGRSSATLRPGKTGLLERWPSDLTYKKDLSR